ncbi:hypothetical protein H1057_07795 [Clostridium sporogenes]|uniref:hypothetical protein n=1 Tax=Clostridium sporogenes TaxID=1509 RepID=UPI0015EFAD6F|nr:hypothetical protein [Clostridium sporogenes]MBA4507953.1 hypothetical protein [Clostridium sporogenes]
MAVGDRIGIADKETLDKTKNNTDKIMQDTTYLRNIKSNNKIPLKLEKITNNIDIQYLPNALNITGYLMEANQAYNYGYYNIGIKDSSGKIIKYYYNERLNGYPGSSTKLLCIHELGLLVTTLSSSSHDGYIYFFNMKNWKFKEIRVTSNTSTEIVGFDWISNSVIVVGDYKIQALTIQNIENLDIVTNDTKMDKPSDQGFKSARCLMYKKNNISYFIHYNGKYVVTEYDSALTPNGITDVLEKSVAKKSEYIITNLDWLPFNDFIVKPIEYNNLIIFQRPFITIDTTQKIAMYGYGLDYSDVAILNNTTSYYLISNNNELFVLASVGNRLFIIKLGDDLKGKCKYLELIFFFDKNGIPLNSTEYINGKLIFYSATSNKGTYVVESIDIKELLDGSEF